LITFEKSTNKLNRNLNLLLQPQLSPKEAGVKVHKVQIKPRNSTKHTSLPITQDLPGKRTHNFRPSTKKRLPQPGGTEARPKKIAKIVTREMVTK